MNIQIIENSTEDVKVIIQCREKNDDISKLQDHIERFNNRVKAKKDNEVQFINISDVLYFESVDNRTFLYTEDDELEVKQRLYELESILPEKDFFRTSKSQIVNINKIKALRPELNRNISVTMCNGEILSMSRKYVSLFKKLLSI